MTTPVADATERGSGWLDALPGLADEVAADLVAGPGDAAGRHGLSCAAVLRCAPLRHMRQETYRRLEFLLRDSLSAQRFARVDTARLPSKPALQETIPAIGGPEPQAVRGPLGPRVSRLTGPRTWSTRFKAQSHPLTMNSREMS